MSAPRRYAIRLQKKTYSNGNEIGHKSRVIHPIDFLVSMSKSMALVHSRALQTPRSLHDKVLLKASIQIIY